MVVLAVSIPTLVGSICSTLAASFIFACYIALPQKTHFRHVLILNLATAGYIILRLAKVNLLIFVQILSMALTTASRAYML